MKGITKFFKKRDDEVLDVQTLSTVSHAELAQIAIKFHTDIKEYNHTIETQEESIKQLKVELSNSNDKIALYKNHSEDLQGYSQKLSIENDSYKTLIESKGQEIKYFRDRCAELEKICESAKNMKSIVAELDIFKQQFKDSQEKIAGLVEENEILIKEKARIDSESKILKDRHDELNKRSQEAESNLKSRSTEFLNVKAELKTAKGKIKEGEIAIKELQAVANGKSHRISELESQLKIITSTLEEKTRKAEELESKLEILSEKHSKELEEKSTLLSTVQEKYEKETADKIEDIYSGLNKNIEEFKIKITTMEIERSKLQAQLQKANQDLTECQQALKLTQDNLEASQKKRELAREEVLKLTQKLERASSPERAPIKPIHTIQPLVSTSNQLEHKALQVLKAQLDSLYKSLMDLMLSANTTRDTATREIKYYISAEVFSKFEKDLNKVVMNAHEAAENPNFLETGPGWMGRMSSWAPSKLFSCMSNENRVNSTNPPEKRRASYKGFF